MNAYPMAGKGPRAINRGAKVAFRRNHRRFARRVAQSEGKPSDALVGSEEELPRPALATHRSRRFFPLSDALGVVYVSRICVWHYRETLWFVAAGLAAALGEAFALA